MSGNRQWFSEEAIESLPGFVREPDIRAGDRLCGLGLPNAPTGELHARSESLVPGGPSFHRRLPDTNDVKLELPENGVCRSGVNGRKASVIRSV